MLLRHLDLIDVLALQDRLRDGLPRRRLSRRLRSMLGNAFTVGTITAFGGLRTNHQISGTLTGTSPVSGGNAPTVDSSYSVPKPWTFNTGGPATGNQVFETIFTAVKNTTTSLILTGALNNFVNDALATLSVVREFWLEYLTTAQDAVNGTGATSTVQIKFSLSNPWTSGPLEATGIIFMKPGEKVFFQNNDATGWTVGPTNKALDFISTVNDFDSHFRVTMIGEK